MAEEEEQGADVDVSELGPHIRQDHARVEPLDDDVPLMRRGGPLRSRGPAVLARLTTASPITAFPTTAAPSPTTASPTSAPGLDAALGILSPSPRTRSG